jgi:hypothetical protein
MNITDASTWLVLRRQWCSVRQAASRISIPETSRRRFAAIEKSPKKLKIPAAPAVLQLPRDIIETSLAHLVGTATRRAYDRYDYWSERIDMAQWWADNLDELRRGD